MKFRAVVTHRDSRQPVGPWRRTYPAALADARADVAPYKRYSWEIEDSAGKSREISETQWERGIGEYHDAIAARDARGVWG